MQILKLGLAGALTGVLAGCTVPSAMNPLNYDPGMNTDVFGIRKVAAVQHVITSDVPHSSAFVIMPQLMGTVVNVSESRAGNGVEQNIVYDAGLSANGENRVRVRMVNNTEWPKEKAEPISLSSIKQRHLVYELRQQFPYVSMQISNRLHTNSYGVFGYAVSRAKAGCFYGWQRMRANEPSRWWKFARESQQPEIGLRVRYCRPGATEEELVALMKNLRVDADPAAALRTNKSRWTARPPNVSSNVIPPDHREPGYMSSPPAFSEPEPAVKAKPPRRRSFFRRTVRRERAVEPVVVEEEVSRAVETDVAVPLPQGGAVPVTPARPTMVTQPRRIQARQVQPRSVVPRAASIVSPTRDLAVLPAPSRALPDVEKEVLPTKTFVPQVPATNVRPRTVAPTAVLPTAGGLDTTIIDGKRVIPLPG